MTKVKNILVRISIFYWLMIVLGLLIAAKVVYLQFSTELKAEAQVLSFKEEKLYPNRGNVLAHDGRILATSVPSYEIRMDFNAKGLHDTIFTTKNVKALAAKLSVFFKDKSALAYENELWDARKNKVKNQNRKIGSRRVNYFELQELKQFPIWKEGGNKGGFIANAKNKREYPYKSLAFRVLGYMNETGAAVGIEKSFDEKLSGTTGLRLVQRIPGGEWMPLSGEENVDPVDGDDVVTTIDIDIQDAAEVAIRERLSDDSSLEGGCIVVMDVKTGEIRAMANMKRNSNGTYTEDYNYAIAQATNPGSTFKLMTLVSLLEDKLYDLDSEIDCGTERVWLYKGQRITEAHATGYGKIPLEKVFEVSSNIGFAKAVVNGYKTNEKAFIDRLYAMNLNQQLDLQIEGEAKPIIKHPDVKNNSWWGASLPMMATGYELQIAPIHTLTFYNAIANNGKMVKPKFVKELRKYGNTVDAFSTDVIDNAICSQGTVEKVQKALLGVVKNGTGKVILDDHYSIAGKTGTAQIAFDNRGFVVNGQKKHQASFCGYFPADKPQYSCIVVLYSAPIPEDKNFYGGKWAAPVFKQVADKVYASKPDWHNPVTFKGEYADLPAIKGGNPKQIAEVVQALNLPVKKQQMTINWATTVVEENKISLKEATVIQNLVPSVTGLGLKDALYMLENAGLKVTFSGRGVVKNQSVQPGLRVSGQTVHLTLE